MNDLLEKIFDTLLKEAIEKIMVLSHGADADMKSYENQGKFQNAKSGRKYRYSFKIEANEEEN